MALNLKNLFSIMFILLAGSPSQANTKYSKCECGPHPTVGNVIILGGYNGTRWEPLAQFIGKRPMFGYNGSAGALQNAQNECENAKKLARECPVTGGGSQYNLNGDFGA